ncbi:hypothetical protein F4859DRAFT_461762 [Xylaria cf. heliscus]|nr:hypothetical protein F4859DRAFT_461762 [Xylaria cf. heliscus]
MMYNSKVLLSAACLTGASLAQSSSSSSSSSAGPDAQCSQSYASLLAAAPTPDDQLASAITSYASGMIQSATGTNVDANPLAFATQVCDFSAALPSSLQSDFDAYVTQIISYVSASSSAIDAVITNCVATGPEAAGYTALVNSFASQTGPLCQASATTGTATATATGTAVGTGIGTGLPYSTFNGTFSTGTPTPTSSATGTGSAGSSTSSVTAGAAAMPTALFGGVAAAAGLLGAVVLL